MTPSFLTESPSQYLNVPVRDGLTSQSGIPWMLLLGVVIIVIVVYLIMRGASARISDDDGDINRACRCKPCACNCGAAQPGVVSPYDGNA